MGIHNNAEGKIALIPVESPDYKRLMKDPRITKLKAFRSAQHEMIDAILTAASANVEQLRADGRTYDSEWWQEQLDWLKQHRDELAEAVLTEHA